MSATYFDALWDAHVVESLQDGNDLLFIDKIVAHEITSCPVLYKSSGILATLFTIQARSSP